MADQKSRTLNPALAHSGSGVRPHFIPTDPATGQPLLAAHAPLPQSGNIAFSGPAAPPYQEPSRHPQQPPVYPQQPPVGAAANINAGYYHPDSKLASDAAYYNNGPHENYAGSSAGGADGFHKSGWAGRIAQMGIKAGAPINALANKLGSNSFLPMTLEKECEKAAVILRSFCEEGVAAADPVGPAANTPASYGVHNNAGPPASSRKALIKIPPSVLAKARGLAIFTTFRLGFHVSGATGSGIVLARLPNGQWGPPSGINIHSLGGGFLIGADIYDCVCVINSQEALAAFTSHRLSLGSDFAVVAGPYGAGAGLDIGHGKAFSKTDSIDHHGQPNAAPAGAAAGPSLNQRPSSSGGGGLKPVYSYVKSRGLYVGISIDGTAFVERTDANAAFYGGPVSADGILHGELPIAAASHSAVWRSSVAPLHDFLRAYDQPFVSSAATGFGPSAPYAAAGAGAPYAAAAVLPLHPAATGVQFATGPVRPPADAPPPSYDYSNSPSAARRDALPPYQGQPPAGLSDSKKPSHS